MQAREEDSPGHERQLYVPPSGGLSQGLLHTGAIPYRCTCPACMPAAPYNSGTVTNWYPFPASC